MKNLKFLLFFLAILALSPSSVFAQSVTLTGPSMGMVEVGIPGIYTATFTPPSGTTVTIVSYTFSAPWIGNGISGPSGIVGSISGNTSSNPLTILSTATSLSVPIIWGDFFNSSTSDEVTVTVAYKIGDNTKTVLAKKSVTIKRICPPIINGPISIQDCCIAPLTYTATACDANSFTWTISSGGTITSGNGTATITVVPPPTSSFTITCVARRSTGLFSYSRTSTITVNRFQPITPAIVAPSFYCTGEVYNICVPTICGASGATWTVPASLQIVEGQGTSCIKVTPTSGASNGTTGAITAQAIMSDACTAKVSSPSNFTIYSAETPPVPQGYITLELDGGDPCNDPVYRVVWHTTTPYTNGYTSVSPGIVLGGVHDNPHDGGAQSRVKITVCNVNLCSGRKSCIEFWIDRPYPCGGDGAPAPGGISNQTIFPELSEERSEQATALNNPEISIYPNPTTSGRFYLTCPAGISGQATLCDLTGKLIAMKTFDASEPTTSLVDSPLEKGVYIVQLRLSNRTVTKKVVVE